MNNYKLRVIRIFSFRWDEALEFYRDVIGFPVTFANADMGWAQFQLGSTDLGLERCDRDDAEAQTLVGRFVGVSIEVKDVQAVYEVLLKKGVEFTSEPTKQPWGGILAHFKDIDGNVLTLVGGDA